MGVSNPSETPTLGLPGIVVEVFLFEKASQDRGGIEEAGGLGKLPNPESRYRSPKGLLVLGALYALLLCSIPLCGDESC